ncbi:Sodium-independent sulfate anion transporter [Folsomia candida]|uniref:Sodium-independent sulfate anion transporter n=1 Tax=Folsomia candida TaxID=158441 RepID=A0A226F2J3_FOLCA|nr:Sodium-independent sulfate anion transporter [Folsomia candida]
MGFFKCRHTAPGVVVDQMLSNLEGGLVTGAMVILALRFLTPYFYYIPKASLAAVIVCAVIFMVDLDVIKPMWRSKKMEFVPWSLTFIVSLFVGLEWGMMTGFIISVVYLLYYAAKPGVKVKKGYTSCGNEFLLVELDRSITFPSLEYIKYVISKSSISWGKNKLPMVVDYEVSQAISRTEVLEQKEVGTEDVTVDVHTPLPHHRNKYNSFPLN